MAIKTTTSGLVITRGGLPSCTCCGLCSPEVTTVYVEELNTTTSAVTYYTLTGSLNDGFFTGLNSESLIVRLDWLLDYYWGCTVDAGDEIVPSFEPPRCDPQAVYEASGDDLYYLTVSFLSLP